MIKRPICVGALLLIAVLLWSNYLGVSETVPHSFQNIGGKQQILGRVAAREKTAGGMRLYLEEFTFLTTSLKISEQISNATSKTISKERSISKILVYLKEEAADISIGSWAAVEGKCFLPDRATNPGQFDARSYYQARNVVFLLRDGEILRQWKGRNGYSDFLAKLRERLRLSMENVLGDEDATLVSAIILGERGMLSGQIKRLYQEGGIAHILAISSLHVTLLGMGFYRMLRKLRWSLGMSGLFSAVFLFSFCVMTGMSVSAMRACIMFLLWLGSQVAGRTNDRPTGAALAAILALLRSPEYLWDSSFLLSFGCILSLQYLTPLVERAIPLPGSVGKSLQASIALQLGTLPIVMYFFYQVTPYAFLVNLAVLPFMQILMVSGLLGSLMGIFCIPLGTLLAAPCHYLLGWFELLCRLERQLPGAVVITGRPALWQIFVYYLILIILCAGVWFGEKSGSTIRGGYLAFRSGVLTAVVLAVFTLNLRFLPRLRITFFDVGQGDGILIQAGQFACMIDGGSSSVDKVWQYRMESTLKYYGISHLDAWFLSHGDYDHISGAEEFLDGYDVNSWGTNVGGITLKYLMFPDTGYEEEKLTEVKALAKERGIATGYLPTGGSVSQGKLKLTCLYPDTQHSTGDSNQDSMVLFLEYGEFTALFTGDLEKEGEGRFLEQWSSWKGPDEKSISLLKVAHHGSKNGTSENFLEAIRPEMAVISCGKNNRYGHPAEELLGRLKNAGVQVYRTDEDGSVTVLIERGTEIIK